MYIIWDILFAGSGFVSQDLYLHGFFSASIKLPADYTAGVVVAFYVSFYLLSFLCSSSKQISPPHLHVIYTSQFNLLLNLINRPHTHMDFIIKNHSLL